MFNSNNLPTLAYFIQAILERNHYFVEDSRYEALGALKEITFSGESGFFQENYLNLYKIFSEEKPEMITKYIGQDKPVPIWDISLRTEKDLREALKEIERLKELE